MKLLQLNSIASFAAIMWCFAGSSADASPIKVADCPSCLFKDYGGPLLSAPKDLYFIYYGAWSGDRALTTLPAFAQALSGSDYLNLLTLYTPTGSQTQINPSLTYSGSLVESAYLGRSLTSGAFGGTNNQISQIVNDATTGHRLPNDPNGIYVVLTDPSIRVQGDSAYCAYHSSTSAGRILALIDFHSVDTSGCGPYGENNMTTAISHELFEAITDPFVSLAVKYAPPLSWYDIVNGEVGDPCNQIDVVLPGTSFVVQSIFAPVSGNNVTGYKGYCSSGVTITSANSGSAPKKPKGQLIGGSYVEDVPEPPLLSLILLTLLSLAVWIRSDRRSLTHHIA